MTHDFNNGSRLTPLIEYLLCITLIFASSCAATVRPPTLEQLAAADYGSAPPTSTIPAMVRKFLKERGYFDPNGAEIEACTEPKRGWTINSYDSIYSGDYIFGWEFFCDVNGKNLSGGFIGFETLRYLARDGAVYYGRLPGQPNLTAPLVTPNSKFVLWD